MLLRLYSLAAQAKAQLEAELALFALDPAPTHTTPTPPHRESLFCSLYPPSCNKTSKLSLLGTD